MNISQHLFTVLSPFDNARYYTGYSSTTSSVLYGGNIPWSYFPTDAGVNRFSRFGLTSQGTHFFRVIYGNAGYSSFPVPYSVSQIGEVGTFNSVVQGSPVKGISTLQPSSNNRMYYIPAIFWTESQSLDVLDSLSLGNDFTPDVIGYEEETI